MRESNTLESVTFRGCYSMSIQVFLGLYQHFKDTGENLLDSYSRVTYLSWDIHKYHNDKAPYLYDYEMCNLYIDDVESIYDAGFISDDQLIQYTQFIDRQRQRYFEFLDKRANKPRIRACKFTKDPAVKRDVYGKYGKVCLCCGSDKNISLDHVIPVVSGGQNEINNMQPLCKSCNSRKGTQTIDYRKQNILP